MFMPEFIRMLAIDLALVLSLFLTGRISLPSASIRLLLRAGLALFLLEDVIRWAIAMALAFVSAESQVGLDFVRQWSTLFGAVGAILACAGLVLITLRAPTASASQPRTMPSS